MLDRVIFSGGVLGYQSTGTYDLKLGVYGKQGAPPYLVTRGQARKQAIAKPYMLYGMNGDEKNEERPHVFGVVGGCLCTLGAGGAGCIGRSVFK